MGSLLILGAGYMGAALAEVAGDVLDLALCMSVNPGWSGQKFIGASLDKLARMRRGLPDELGMTELAEKR